jgi:hypothetical protein
MLEVSSSKSLAESTLAFGAQLAAGKWAEYVDGLEGSTRDITALLLENEAQYLDNLDETTKVVNIGNFYKFAFPMVRAIFPNLVAMDIVSVQPMQGPVSLVFYLDFIYGSTKGDITRGDRLYKSGFPHATAQNEANYDGHDSNHLFSSETVNLEVAVNGSGSALVLSGAGDLGSTAAATSFKPVRPGSLEIWVGSSRSTAVIAATADASGTIAKATGSPAAVTSVTGTITHSTTTGTNIAALVIDTDGSSPYQNAKIYFTYRFAAEGTNQVMEIDLQLQSTSVTAERRALKANWSVEAANDLKALHNLDVEAELTAVLADEIRFEIDREIIEDLRATSVSNGAAVREWDRSTASGNYAYYEKKMEFYDELVAQSNRIFRMTRRAAGNFVVAGIDVCDTIEALPGFQPTNVVGNGVVKIGTVKGQWDVYKDPYLVGNIGTDPNQIGNEYLMGYKGSSFLDAGFVFAPYIPLYTTPTYVFADFVGTKGIMSRYGKKVINNRFYVGGRVIGSY